MSKREEIQDELAAFIEARKNDQGYPYFNAPYGVITGIDKLGRGKMRTITFGVCRYLDAVVKIITPTNIQIEGQGGLAHKYDGEYKSVEEVKKVLAN